MAVPKPFRLFIPRKTQNPVQQPDYGVDMRAIEAWAIAVVNFVDSIAGGGGYASLTGPGQTVTPGALTQNGDLTVDGHLNVEEEPLTVQSTTFGSDYVIDPIAAAGINTTITASGIIENVTHSIQTTAGGAVNITAGVAQTLVISAGNSAVECDGSTNSLFVGTGPGGTNITYGRSTSTMGFFGASTVAQPNVTGSRGGNVALANLLTALNNLGLITNSTTP